MRLSNQVQGMRREVLPTKLVGPAEGYGRWASTYDRTPNPLLAREERYVIPRLPDLSGMDAIDVACGTGRWLAYLLARGVHSGIGLDTSSAMLRAAGGKERVRGRLVQADCLHLPFGAASFDFAICSFAVGHFQNVGLLLRELARILKPGSRLIVTDLHPAAYAIGWRTGFRDELGPAQIETHLCSMNEMESVSSKIGFDRLAYAELCIEAAEKPIFQAANKRELFDEVIDKPAIFVLELKRIASVEPDTVPEEPSA